MNVENIFNLLRKFNKEEDIISAGFGFLLKQNKKLLKSFLEKININLSPKELTQVDIDTQFSYESSGSIIDLQLTIYGKFLVFLESKIVKNENDIIEQLNKYANILNSIRDQYDDVKLIYVNKFPIDKKRQDDIFSQINFDRNKSFFFTWENLLDITNEYKKDKIVKQFRNYIGDKMYSKTEIGEQKIKVIPEVLVIHTNEENWTLIQKKNIAVQKNGSSDAQYLAFYRTHMKDENGKKLVQAITHIAKVKSTEKNVPRSETVKEVPELEKWYKKKHADMSGTHKHYNLEEPIKLEREIPFIKGGKPIGQVRFKTRMSELLRAKTISDLKKLKDFKS